MMPDFTIRIAASTRTEKEYKAFLLSQINAFHFHILFEVLQNTATRWKNGNEEDMELHTRAFESACTAMARYLGLATEIEKEEDEKKEPGEHEWL